MRTGSLSQKLKTLNYCYDVKFVKKVPFPSYAVEVIDTTAAGDAFVGTFAVALTEGKPTLEAAIFGNAAGALTVTRSGAHPSLPTRAELDQFLEQKKQRLRKKHNH